MRFNPELNGKFVAIPGLFAFVVYQIAMVVASVTLVRERELGTLEQLAVTPMRRVELLTGKAIPAILVGLVNFVLLLAVVVGVFDIPMRGSYGPALRPVRAVHHGRGRRGAVDLGRVPLAAAGRADGLPPGHGRSGPVWLPGSGGEHAARPASAVASSRRCATT